MTSYQPVPVPVACSCSSFPTSKLSFFFISLFAQTPPCSHLLTYPAPARAACTTAETPSVGFVAILFGGASFRHAVGDIYPELSSGHHKSLECSRHIFGRVGNSSRFVCVVRYVEGGTKSKYGMTFVTVCDGVGANETSCHCSCQSTWDGRGSNNSTNLLLCKLWMRSTCFATEVGIVTFPCVRFTVGLLHLSRCGLEVSVRGVDCLCIGER